MRSAKKIKVCGMKDLENIQALATLPIDYMGLIFYAKSPRFVNDSIPADVVSTVKKVGVFVNESIETILLKVNTYQLHAVQLHGNEVPGLCASLQAKGIEVIKAFGIDDSFTWSVLEAYVDHVDYFLFDTKSPQHGGTGHTFDWQKLREYPYDKPYFLSGGLSLENVGQAAQFEDERLIGLDLNSRFEIEPGLKNINLLTQALKIINGTVQKAP